MPIPLVNIPRPQFRLGAEELIELGQPPSSGSPVSSIAALNTPITAPARVVQISRDEGLLLVKLVEDIVSFAGANAVEFQSYCPPERWQTALTHAGTWVHEIERQLKTGAQQIPVPAESIFRIIDLEKCVSAARDARISSARLAFGLSAAGTIANVLLGWTWVSVPVYLAGLAVLFGRPLYARFSTEPEEAFKPILSGRNARPCLGGGSRMNLKKGEGFSLGDHTDKTKVLERVIVALSPEEQEYHWGKVSASYGPVYRATCLSQGRFRVRVEGWSGDKISINEDWERVALRECESRNEIVVWSPSGTIPRGTPYGEIPPSSGHEETFWIEYIGPRTNGIVRVAGPFG